ncbi:MAG: hypothetical protein M3355_00250 [Actinomycetota bacterium]|nr:hypothetical protein [Actinomycetota bacterium]
MDDGSAFSLWSEDSCLSIAGSIMSARESGAVFNEENKRAGLLTAGILIGIGVVAGVATWRASR